MWIDLKVSMLNEISQTFGKYGHFYLEVISINTSNDNFLLIFSHIYLLPIDLDLIPNMFILMIGLVDYLQPIHSFRYLSLPN